MQKLHPGVSIYQVTPHLGTCGVTWKGKVTVGLVMGFCLQAGLRFDSIPSVIKEVAEVASGRPADASCYY